MIFSCLNGVQSIWCLIYEIHTGEEKISIAFINNCLMYLFFNPSFPVQVLKLLFEKFNLPISHLTLLYCRVFFFYFVTLVFASEAAGLHLQKTNYKVKEFHFYIYLATLYLLKGTPSFMFLRKKQKSTNLTRSDLLNYLG